MEYAMQNNLSRFFARIDAWFLRREQRALEAYLAASQNVAELETRMRDIDRGAPLPYY
jgi:hypothetical protein